MNDGSRASGGAELRTLTLSTVKSGHVGSERNPLQTANQERILQRQIFSILIQFYKKLFYN